MIIFIIAKDFKVEKKERNSLDENWIKLSECLRNSLGFFSSKVVCDSMRTKAGRKQG